MIQWLLRNNPDLLGDILEERANGRSRAWLWRQMLIAVGRSMVDQGRRHPIVTLRAAALASFAYCIAFFGTARYTTDGDSACLHACISHASTDNLLLPHAHRLAHAGVRH